MPFEALCETLLRGGIAPRHVRRTLGELQDHLADLTEQQHAAGYDREDAALRARAALGDDVRLAAAMLAQPRLRSWTARAPWLVFGLLPPLAIILAMTLPVLVLVVLGRTLGFTGPHKSIPPDWFHMLASLVIYGSNLLLAPLLALLFAVIAQRQRLKLRWPRLATALLILLFAQNAMRFAPDGRIDSLAVGIGTIFHARTWREMPTAWPLLVAQWLLTVLPVGWLSHRRMSTAA